jgi:hypothetical protein
LGSSRDPSRMSVKIMPTPRMRARRWRMVLPMLAFAIVFVNGGCVFGGCVFGRHPRRKVKPPKEVGAERPAPRQGLVC